MVMVMMMTMNDDIGTNTKLFYLHQIGEMMRGRDSVLSSNKRLFADRMINTNVDMKL
jgi:hypothetical protein